MAIRKKPVTIKKAKLPVKKEGVLHVKKTSKKSMKEAVVEVREETKDVTGKISYPVLSTSGEKSGVISLPKSMFGVPYNKQLVAQAMRVYQMNQREGSASTKTRGLVEGSTRKIYRQKGTGRARHGGIRAPIFVGGGITFGPLPRDIHKTMPKQMKKKSLSCVLSLGVENKTMKVVDGLTALPVKTKSFASMLETITLSKRTLFVYGKETASVVKAVRNIKNVTVLPFDAFGTYDVMTHSYVVFAKDAVSSLIEKGTKS